MDMKLEGATLANLAEGELEVMFQDRLKELAAIAMDLGAFESKGGMVNVKIRMDATFGISMDNGTMVVAVGADLIRPKRKMAARGIYRRGNEFFVAPEPQQERLPLKLTPISRAGEGGEPR